jgi:hypothetical protein
MQVENDTPIDMLNYTKRIDPFTNVYTTYIE